MQFNILALGTLLLGLVLGYVARKFILGAAARSAEERAATILKDTSAKAKELLLEAKDKAMRLAEEGKIEEQKRHVELKEVQTRLDKREAMFDAKLLDLDKKQQMLQADEQKLKTVTQEIEKVKEEQKEKLQKIAELSTDEARKVLMNFVEKQSKDELVARMRKLENETQETITKKANDILAGVIERCAGTFTAETTTLTVALPSDEMKGRIIGKEGRNIRTIERLTGTELIIDETPQAITISSFNPLRRHLAKKVLEKLIADGRIHPGRIEEVVEATKADLANEIKKAGDDALAELGITDFDPKLTALVGRLKFRTSFGQNQLEHAVEVAQLAKSLALELKANQTVALYGGLLHDIGKALDREREGTHMAIGAEIAKQYKLHPDVTAIIDGAHTDAPRTMEAAIVNAADAISASRPGARRDSFENYIKRVTDLEAIAKAYPDVAQAYAISAGREIRIFVTPEKIDDLAAEKIAREVAKKVEESLVYPGEIRVTVIREKRVVEYAR